MADELKYNFGRLLELIGAKSLLLSTPIKFLYSSEFTHVIRQAPAYDRPIPHCSKSFIKMDFGIGHPICEGLMVSWPYSNPKPIPKHNFSSTRLPGFLLAGVVSRTFGCSLAAANKKVLNYSLTLP